MAAAILIIAALSSMPLSLDLYQEPAISAAIRRGLAEGDVLDSTPESSGSNKRAAAARRESNMTFIYSSLMKVPSPIYNAS